MDLAPTEVFEDGWSIEPVPAPEPVGTQRRRSRLRLLPRRRRWWWLAGLVAVLVMAAAAAAELASGTGAGTTYQTVTASTGTMRLTTAATGTLEPAQRADLSFQVSGQVLTVPVSVGQHVTAGQTLATISSASLAAQESQAQATLSGAQARLSADQAAGASAAQVDADQAAVDAAQAGLRNARASLSQATLTAPTAGTVAQLDLVVGQQVTGSGSGGSGTASAAGSGVGGASGGGSNGGAGSGAASGAGSGGTGSTGSGTAQVVVVGSAFVVDTAVDDTQVGLLRAGEQAVIVPQGVNTPVYGTVSSVGLLAGSTSGVASFPVVIAVTGTPAGLHAGATASVSIVYRQLNNVVEVPAAAVRYSGGRASVLTPRPGGGSVSVPVTVGAATGGLVQIVSGVSAGQQVLVARSNTPRTGTSAGPGGARGGRGGFGGGGFGGGGFGGRGGAGG